MTAIGLHGGGMMAREILRQAANHDTVRVAAIISRSAVPWAADIPQYPSLEALQQEIDLLVDFTLPDGLRSACQWCAQTAVPLLSGTTGLQASHKQALENTALHTAVLWSPNLSMGINLMRLFVEEAAATLGSSVQVDIEDLHHVHKKDAPSGTALALAETVAVARGLSSEQVIRPGPVPRRDRKPGDIVMTSVRKDEEVGTHSVRFTLSGEHLEITHRAEDRSIYALGALAAAHWLAGQKAGMYSAADYLAALAGAVRRS
jgi:4-hydroxy-tetrahydrodipicolinate reductase